MLASVSAAISIADRFDPRVYAMITPPSSRRGLEAADALAGGLEGALAKPSLRGVIRAGGVTGWFFLHVWRGGMHCTAPWDT